MELTPGLHIDKAQTAFFVQNSAYPTKLREGIRGDPAGCKCCVPKASCKGRSSSLLVSLVCRDASQNGTELQLHCMKDVLTLTCFSGWLIPPLIEPLPQPWAFRGYCLVQLFPPTASQWSGRSLARRAASRAAVSWGPPGPPHRQRGFPGTAQLVPPSPREGTLSHRRAVVPQGKAPKCPLRAGQCQGTLLSWGDTSHMGSGYHPCQCATGGHSNCKLS